MKNKKELDYEIFRNKNNILRDKLGVNGSRRFKVTRICNNTCYLLDSSNRTITCTVSDVIKNVLSGRICLSNPSKFSSFNFSKVFPTKKITKKDYRTKELEKIISDNWNSVNGKFKVFPTKDSNIITLYHGSRDGIFGDINPTSHSRNNCDFGLGFYTGDLKEQAELLIKDTGSKKILYTLKVDLSNVAVYDLSKDPVKWALYIAVNRGKIDISKYPKLGLLVQEIEKYSVIKGLIADDEMLEAFNSFLADSLSIQGLIFCLGKVNLGMQYVFKTLNACNKLSYADIKPFTNETRLNLETFHNKIKRGKEGVVEEALENHNDGKRFRELLKEFK